MRKRLPKMKTDAKAESLLKKDISEFLIKKNFKRVSFEFEPKTKSISLRLSESLLKALKQEAKKRGINYQKLIREAVEESFNKKAA